MENEREMLNKILEHNFLARNLKIQLEEVLENRDYFKKTLEKVKTKREIPSILGVIETAFCFGKADGHITGILRYLTDRGLISSDVANEIADYLEDVGTDTYRTMESLGSAIDELIKSKSKEIVG